MMLLKRLGWHKELPDFRDFKLQLRREFTQDLPPSIDLSSKFPPVYDQGNLGSCTAQAVAGLIEYDRKREGRIDFIPSRLFIYYNERVIEDTVNDDSGATIRDSFKSIGHYGFCDEKLWSYDIRKFTIKPPMEVYGEALKEVTKKYVKVKQTLNGMLSAIASDYCIVLGISVYDSFPMDNGIDTIPMPSKTDHLIGGHALVIVGYDTENKLFLFRNSWGKEWGKNGYATIPFNYLLSPGLCADLWTITDPALR